MDTGQNEMPLEEFIALPSTVSLISRDGSLANENFRKAHNIRAGAVLAGDYHIDYVHRGEVEAILTETGENLLTMIPVVMGLMDRESLEASGIAPLHTNPYLDLRGRGTLIGFVDTGIDFTQEAFIYEDGTSKISYIWDQRAKSNPPEGFFFGREYTNKEINEALKAENPTDVLPHRDEVGHGTFLASLAAGREYGEYIGMAPEAEIIAVKLKKAEPFFYERFLVPKWQENAYLSSDVMQGIQYIINRAAWLGRPVAICIALGTNLGGHDGSNMLEEYLTRISSTTGVAIACAAGNESQGAKHAQGQLGESGQSQNVELAVKNQEEDIYISLWSQASDRVAVSITSPGGELVPKIPVRSGSSYSTSLVLEKSRVTVEYFLPVRGTGDQFTAIKILHPTPGIWNITVHGEIVLEGGFHMWLPITGFADPETVFLKPSPEYTVVIPATAMGVVTCGAYDSRSNSLYGASSWGPTRLRMAPDLAAPGVSVGGSYPTGHGKLTGTSAAASITAGACALMLQWGIVNKNEVSLTSNRIRANLIRGCTRDPNINYPNVQWGYGRLNLYNTLSAIRPINVL